MKVKQTEQKKQKKSFQPFLSSFFPSSLAKSKQIKKQKQKTNENNSRKLDSSTVVGYPK